MHSHRATSRCASVSHALKGVAILLMTQQNARIHAVATIAVIAAGIWLEISSFGWASIALAVSLVWIAEGLNTALEFLVDLVSPSHQPLAGKVKDVAAGAVLLAAIGAMIVGITVFWPHILKLLNP